MDMYLDQSIWQAIKSHAETDPVDLPEILLRVDYYERIALTDEELIGGLTRLIARGVVGELPGHRFFARSEPVPNVFSGLSPQEAAAANAEALRRFEVAAARVDQGIVSGPDERLSGNRPNDPGA